MSQTYSIRVEPAGFVLLSSDSAPVPGDWQEVDLPVWGKAFYDPDSVGHANLLAERLLERGGHVAEFGVRGVMVVELDCEDFHAARRALTSIRGFRDLHRFS